MKINVSNHANEQFQASMLIVAIIGTQIGIGIAGFQRIIYNEAKQDSWLSVIIAGIFVQLILWVIIKTLQTEQNADLYGLNVYAFGKWLGKLFNLIYIGYLTLACTTVLVDYILIVKVWVFPGLAEWKLSVMLLFLTVYGVLGGVRVVVGVSFIVFFATAWILILSAEPLKYADWGHFFPMFQATPVELLKGAYRMSLTVLGFEVIYFLYPYVKNKEKVMLYSQLGAFLSHSIMLIVMVVSLSYFSHEQLNKTVWATLTMFKIIHLPNIERFEILAVSIWMLVILPNLLLFLWAATRGIKRSFNINERLSLLFIVPIMFATSIHLRDARTIIAFTDFVSIVGFIATFIFPILLFLVVFFKKNGETKRGIR